MLLDLDTSFFGVLLGLAVSYILATAVYNVYFHPLAKFPGPILNSAFHFPYFWSLYQGRVHETTKQIHDRYGEVVRVKPDFLTFASVQAWKDIYGTRPGLGQIPKDPNFYAIEGMNKTHIVYSNDADHTRMRKLLAHAFSDSALRDQEGILVEYFNLLVSRLGQTSDKQVVDIAKWYNYLTFDIVADLCFGESFHALETGEYHTWVRNIFRGIKTSRILPIASFYKPAMKILKLIVYAVPSIQQARREHESFSKLKTLKRLEMDTDRKDFMNYVLRHNDSRGMTQKEIIDTFEILLIAGSETTATLLSGATYYLLTNEAVYTKAKDEVRQAFKTQEEMTLAATSKLPYLQAVLEEALRMYPPVPLALPRRTRKEGAHVAGTWVPGNTSVAVPQWTVNNSEAHWEEPHQFAPERWLEKPPAKYANDDREIRNPFTVGPRNCIGRNLAYHEMRSILARMLWNFDLELSAESKAWKQQRVFFLWDKQPLHVHLNVRKDLK